MSTGAATWAVYRLFSAEGQLLYVGHTGNPRERLRRHKTSKPWWGEVHHHTVEWFTSRWDACQAEITAIRQEGPRYNIGSTDQHRARQSAIAKTISPLRKRARAVGVQARNLQVRTYRQLLAEGLPEEEAKRQAAAAREAHKEASGLF